MSCRITKERCFECRNGAALIAITAVGAFPDWWKTGWKYGRVEVRIGICRAGEDADQLDLLNEVSVIG